MATSEKILQSVREIFGLPVKDSKNACVKINVHLLKNDENRQKVVSRPLLIFMGEKH